eukprot:251988_1
MASSSNSNAIKGQQTEEKSYRVNNEGSKKFNTRSVGTTGLLRLYSGLMGASSSATNSSNVSSKNNLNRLVLQSTGNVDGNYAKKRWRICTH